MHIAEGYLPVSHCIGWAVVSLPFLVIGTKAIQKERKKGKIAEVRLGATTAALFLLTALKLPSVAGSSSHPTGGGLGIVLQGPLVLAPLSLIVLIFQALILSHGGITTLGANVFSMGVAGPWAGYAVYKLLSKLSPAGWMAIIVAPFMGAFVADFFTYFVTSLQLGLAYPQGNVILATGKFLGMFAPVQFPLAVAEGALTVALVRWIKAGDKVEALEGGKA